MAPMDVEKRMNLSLDAIIKQNTGKGKSGRGKPQAAKGREKAVAERLSAKKDRGRGRARNPESSQKVKKLGLGVQKKGLKIQRSGKKVAVAAAAQPRRGASKGRRGSLGRAGGNPRAAANPRRAEPEVRARNRGPRPSGRDAAKRTVDLPRLTDLRITISNEKAAAPAYPSVGAPGFQHSSYQSQQPMWAAPSHVMQQPVYGYGPRNLQPRDGAYPRMAPEIPTRVVPEIPVPRARMDYGLSRKALGAQPYVPRRAYKDFDDPSQNKSYMRMDTR